MTAQLAPRSAGAVTRGRLTDEERRWRTVTGGELQRQITDLAELLGWSWLHIRPGLRANGRWYVPVEGPLGKGWPDLVLVRAGGYEEARIVFAELKRQIGDDLTDDQEHVIHVLRTLSDDVLRLSDAPHRSIEVHVWRPSDLRDPIESSPIYEVLR